MARPGTIKKGEVRNPKGRPKGSGYKQDLDAALLRYGKEKFFDKMFKMAETEPAVAVALLKKLVPDQIEVAEKPLMVLDE